MAIVFEGQTYNQNWEPIDAMGNILGPKDVRANAKSSSLTGAQNPYTNQPGSSIYDDSGLIPGNEPGSTLPKGPAPGGWIDHAKIAAYQRSLMAPQAPMPTFGSAPQSPYVAASQPQRQSPSVSSAGGSAPQLTQGPSNMEDARRGIEALYQQYLGRPADPGDADKWLTGQYGHGSGLQDWSKYVAAIMGSPEARAYRPAPSTDPLDAVHGLQYWQSQGVPTIDIFDPTTGQLRPGWVRTATGYARDPNAQTTTNIGGRPDPGPPRSNAPGDIQPWFLSLVQGLPPSPQSLKQLEPILNRYGIRLGPPNARGWSDGIFLPDGTFRDVIIAATENGGQGWAFFVPGPSEGTGGAGPGISGVQTPPAQYSDPHTKLLEEMMLGRINSLQSGSDPAYQQLLQYLQQRFTDLQGPGRTGAEQEVIRTQALDPIERDRTAAKKRMMERISAMGYTLESGVAQQLLQEVDKEFDSFRAQSQTAMAADELNRREGRNQYAEGLAMSLYGLPQDRAREAVGYAGNLSDLGPQRLQLAMQAAGMGGNPTSNFSNLMQLAQMNQQSQLYNQQRGSQWYNALGSIAAMLMNAGR